MITIPAIVIYDGRHVDFVKTTPFMYDLLPVRRMTTRFAADDMVHRSAGKRSG
jgi:hypothetical protein